MARATIDEQKELDWTKIWPSTSRSVRLEGSIDAEDWSKEFAEVVKDRPDLRFDYDFLTAWFANALRVGRHFGERGSEDKLRQAVKDEHDRAIAGIGYLLVALGNNDKAYTTPELLEIWEEGYLYSVVDEEDEDD